MLCPAARQTDDQTAWITGCAKNRMYGKQAVVCTGKLSKRSRNSRRFQADPAVFQAVLADNLTEAKKLNTFKKNACFPAARPGLERQPQRPS